MTLWLRDVMCSTEEMKKNEFSLSRLIEFIEKYFSTEVRANAKHSYLATGRHCEKRRDCYIIHIVFCFLLLSYVLSYTFSCFLFACGCCWRWCGCCTPFAVGILLASFISFYTCVYEKQHIANGLSFCALQTPCCVLFFLFLLLLIHVINDLDVPYRHI